MAFFSKRTSYKSFDPYEFFDKRYGREDAALKDFFRQRLDGDDAYTSSAYKLGSRGIEDAYRRRRNVMATHIAGRGMATSGAGVRARADVEAGRNQQLSDLISKLTMQREREIPQMMSTYLANQARVKPQRSAKTHMSKFEKTMGILEMLKKGGDVVSGFSGGMGISATPPQTGVPNPSGAGGGYSADADDLYRILTRGY